MTNQAKLAFAKLAAQAEILQWIDDLGREATKNCSVHDMNEYNQKYGEGVSFAVHSKLVDDVLPKLEQLKEEQK